MRKLLALSIAAALVAGPTFAASPSLANGAFALAQVQTQNNLVELDNVRAPAAGVVEIYDYNTDQVGQLLGATPVRAGVNTDVNVTLVRTPFNDAIAVLKVDGQVIGQQTVRFAD